MRRSMLLVPVMVALTACGPSGAEAGAGPPSGGSLSPPAASGSPTPLAPLDPLEGEWRTEFTCQESVRAVQRRLSDAEVRRQMGDWAGYVAVWNAEPTPEDPCHGATSATLGMIARFEDGNLALCESDSGACDVHATYVLDGGSITITDPEDNLCPCPARWRFRVVGDRVTFRTGQSGFVIGTWEAAPWTREG
jgi:hypothetical protein